MSWKSFIDMVVPNLLTKGTDDGSSITSLKESIKVIAAELTKLETLSELDKSTYVIPVFNNFISLIDDFPQEGFQMLHSVARRRDRKRVVELGRLFERSPVPQRPATASLSVSLLLK
ncbi:MAG: hypothetical protein WBB01_20805 [Phormidesmis sp.]